MRRCGVDRGTRARTASSSYSRFLIAALTLAVVAGAARVDAASLSLSWNAPTTNIDGTPLSDLAGYRVYLASTSPVCPGASFFTVSSPTPAPAPGQTVASLVTSLGAGATYFMRVTAVDTSGNEGPCSGLASGIAQADFSVTPSTPTGFGNVLVGSILDRTFTVQNTSTATISGGVSVGAPFSIVSGGSFTLAPGASRIVTVRFQPTILGTFAGNVNFTVAGDTLSRAVSGSTVALPGTLSVTKSGTGTGTVTSAPTGIACGTDCTESVAPGTPYSLTATAAAGSTFVGWGGACSGTAACAVTVSANTAVTATFDASQPSPPPPGQEIIVDNADPGVQDPTGGRTFTGTWCLAGSPTGFGPNSLYACGSGTNTYRWTPRIPVAGAYDVYVWVATSPYFSTSVPFVVAHVQGTSTRNLDQRTGAGRWLLHGRYTFNAGTTGYVETSFGLSSGEPPTAGADAVRFVPVASAQVPVTLSVTTSGNGTGTVTSAPTGIACGTDCTESVAPGTPFTLTATAAAGSTFVGWGGACSGTAACAVTVSANTAVTATFDTSQPSPPPPAQEITVDNADPGVQDPTGGRTFTGTWCLASDPTRFGPDSLYACGSGTNTYRWTPGIPVAGAYDVYVWVATSPYFSTSVPFVVAHAQGTSTRNLDQRTGAGRWLLHGRYTFNAGTTGYVETSFGGGPPTAGADAVRFVPVGSAAPPPGSPPPSGLVAAFAFDETNGFTVADVSGNDNTGTLGFGVTRTPQGRFGRALVFNGASFVTVPSTASLNLTTGMTLEAWVFPTVTPTNWATALLKEQQGGLVYTLYTGSATNSASVYFNTGTSSSTERGFAGPSTLPLNTWSHLAATYDGTTLRLYVNGTEVANADVTGAIATSTGALYIGGNAVWGEYFQGLIDNVRIYNRALSPAEIQTDMNTAVGG